MRGDAETFQRAGAPSFRTGRETEPWIIAKLSS
jgi:hypothetical protein